VTGDPRQQAEQALRDWLAEAGVASEPGERPGEHVLQLPGEAKLRTTVSLLLGDRAMTASAFVVRQPDENHQAFYRWLLTRNARLPGIAFALDRLGDVYLVGRLPIGAVTVGAVDDLLGALLGVADSSFNELLALGFRSSIEREWRWRTDRGEPTDNLAPFIHLLDP
jgi:hypothetical protein